MEKQEVLNAVKQLVAEKQLTRRELLSAYDSGTTHRSAGLARIMYYIGGAVVFLGVAILIGQNWDVLSGFSKIVATLGVAVAAFVAGCVLRGKPSTAAVADAAFLVAGLVAPIGAFVLINQLGADPSQPFNQLTTAAALFFLFFAAWFIIQRTVLEVFTFVFAAALLFTVTNFVTSTTPGADATSLYQYTCLVVGAAYMAFGWWYSRSGRALAGALNTFGVLFFLGAAFALGGFFPNQNVFWEIAMPLLALGVMFASVRIQSRAYLVLGAIALVADILKITNEYFTGSLGWPLALVVAGLLLIAVGFYSVQVRRRFEA